VIADDLLGESVNYNNQVVPSPGTDPDLGHVRTPDVIGIIRLGLGMRNLTFSPVVFLVYQQIILFHQLIDAFFIDFNALSIIEIGPASAVTPKGMIRLDGVDHWQYHSPMICFKRWFSSESFFPHLVIFLLSKAECPYWSSCSLQR